MTSKWTVRKLSDIAVINPRERLSKGTLAKKVPMDKLAPFCRDIPDYIFEEYQGGAKFRNGDTIMARITPCLENGKIAKVGVLDKGEIGFGSTEYIVFRAVEGVSDSDYLYYLICSPIVHFPAIKSMVGSSGRQRVQKDVIANLEIKVPPIEEQRRIGALLKYFDDRIELNNAINNNLEQQVYAVYQAWFEDFNRFDGICPQTWKKGILSNIASITSGKRPPMKSIDKTEEAIIPLVGAASVMGYTSEANHVDRILVTGRVGTHGAIQRFNIPCWTSDNTLVITSDLYEYTYQILQRIDYHSMNRGSTQPLITQGDMNKTAILLPDKEILNEFESLAGQLMAQVESNIQENSKLAELRDTLLPKLMSGELDVSDIDL